jgi:hypothetical protein
MRRERWKTVCARVADLALLGGRSASPLGVARRGKMNTALRTLLAIAVTTLVVIAIARFRASRQTIWINPASLELGPIRHAKLPPSLVERITAFESIFADVYPITHQEWLDGFQRDEDPLREIATWEQIAKALTQFTVDRNPTKEVRREAFDLLLVRSGATTEDALKSAKLNYLTPGEARTLCDLYDALPNPIQVEKD